MPCILTIEKSFFSGPELAEASFSALPGKSGPNNSLTSAILISEAQTYPQKKFDDEYAYKFLERNSLVDVSYSVNCIS